MQITELQSPWLIKNQGDFFQALIHVLKKAKIQNGDILVIASKVIARSEGNIRSLNKVRVGTKAKKLAKQYQMNPFFVQIILKEADNIIGGVKGTLLTIKNDLLIANAGIDQSNAFKGFVVLWPKHPARSASQIKKWVKKQFKKQIGIIIVDSHCHPYRLGTSGLALAIAGFKGVVDCRQMKDLSGRKLIITFSNKADDLASAAHCQMGEAAERTPFVLIKKAPIKITNQSADKLTKQLIIKRQSCLFHQSKL